MSDWSHEWGDTPCGRCKGTRGQHEKTCPTLAPRKTLQVKKRPEVVEAIAYERCTADAFGYRRAEGVVMVFDGRGRPVMPNEPEENLVPMLHTKDGYVEIPKNGWVLNHPDGTRSAVTDEVFRAIYEAP